MGQHTPLATGSIEIKDGVEDVTHIHGSGATSRLGRGKQWGNQSVLVVGQVGRIRLCFHTFILRRLTLFAQTLSKYLGLNSRKGKITHRAELAQETDYTILQRYQSVLRGIYNFYCMTNNVSKRMGKINLILKTSLLKTLANKYKSKVNKMVRKYQMATSEGKMLQATIAHPVRNR